MMYRWFEENVVTKGSQEADLVFPVEAIIHYSNFHLYDNFIENRTTVGTGVMETGCTGRASGWALTPRRRTWEAGNK